jgi:hypothetical protein
MALAREEMALRALRDISSGAVYCTVCGKIQGEECLQPFSCDWRQQPAEEIARDALEANRIMRQHEGPSERPH